MQKVALSQQTNEFDQYPEFERSVVESLKSFGKIPLFTTDVDGLFDIYLASIPEEYRQHYNCHTCEIFLERYGGLVTIDELGRVMPVMWCGNIPTFFSESVSNMQRAIKRASITGIFLSKDSVLGIPITGEWTHLHAMNPIRFESRLHSAKQVMAEKKADFQLLKDSLFAYPINVLEQVIEILKTDSLYRSEKVLGIAEWFRDVQTSYKSAKNTRIRNALLWRAVALAPQGYCHVKNTVIGTLLDDIVSGMAFEQASCRFAAKMHPLQYQRPQVAPSSGNIERAEKLVEKLGIENSLVRRFARLDEIQKVWKPIQHTEKSSNGVFSHLAPKKFKSLIKMDIPEISITWRKFLETVLPSTVSMNLYVKSRDNFCAILTAQYPDEPPILQWDNQDCRNPFSWYVYHTGSEASQWGLVYGWTKVTGIAYQPSMWYQENFHQGKSVIFLLDGARDSKYRTSGNALFPEILKAELREVRSTIEAYSKKAEILGYESASACGVRFPSEVRIRVVTNSGVRSTYKIDRWD